MDKMKCAVLGATGVAGQQFIEALAGHPWFEITGLYASEKSANKKYKEACTWHSPTPLEEAVGEQKVQLLDNVGSDLKQYEIIFSALPSEVARQIEGACAKEKPVISTAAAYRYEEDVPVLIPEVNAEHAGLIKVQQKGRGWKGFVVPGPNCTTMGLAITLKPIADSFGIKNVFMTSMQALSGAGYPGVPSLDIIDNIIPYISKEEEKVEQEAVKILGKCSGSSVANAGFRISCTCTRANVSDGHTESVFVETEKHAAVEDVSAAMERFNSECKKKFGHLPSAPERTIVIKEEENRPQPRLDRELGGGMSTVVGRIRKDAVFENGVKYVLLSHNTKKGAAKGEVMAAEYLHKAGYF